MVWNVWADALNDSFYDCNELAYSNYLKYIKWDYKLYSLSLLLDVIWSNNLQFLTSTQIQFNQHVYIQN